MKELNLLQNKNRNCTADFQNQTNYLLCACLFYIDHFLITRSHKNQKSWKCLHREVKKERTKRSGRNPEPQTEVRLN